MEKVYRGRLRYKAFTGFYIQKAYHESAPKTLFDLKMSEKFKIEEEGKIFRRRSHSYVEERFFLMTKILDFAAICNRKGFWEWTHPYTAISKILRRSSLKNFTEHSI